MYVITKFILPSWWSNTFGRWILKQQHHVIVIILTLLTVLTY